MPRWNRPTYDMARSAQKIAIRQVIDARLGQAQGERMKGIFPLGIHFYLMQIDADGVQMKRFAQNAARYDTLYADESEELRRRFDMLGG